MRRDDARKLAPAAQHERRRQAVRAYKRGLNRRQIAREVGLSYPATCRVIERYRAGGMRALAPRRRGRPSGARRRLSVEQEARIRKLICDKRPEQLKLEFALWSRIAVGELIEREYGIRLHVRSVGKYLKRWGFTPQKPIRRAYEQSPAAVKRWLDEAYPGIARRAKREGAEIHWGDETALVNTDVRGRSFAPRGNTPVARVVGGTRHKLSMISTVTNQGKVRWMITEGAFNHAKLIEFFEALVEDADTKVFLILDNLRVHHCKPVKTWLADHSKEIEVFYLPSYSPELNPDERLNADLKQTTGQRAPARTKEKLRAVTTSFMSWLEDQPTRIQSYFHDPKVRYAA